ncbi:MAG TPA: preprotein translocase subunit SecE [Steroidobacteraceae bacterium]|jgi:preprotein translocase subunit SecE|nr:preprotein translocase subunit SecE [Steroidobacteraceae bacterium]
MAEVQTSVAASTKDNTLMALSIVVLLAGIVAFYWFDEDALALRLAMVGGGLVIACGLIWVSWYGREFRQFAQAARVELRKVVWPSREDTVRTTVMVIIFAIVMGVFFWVLDMILTWLIRWLTGQPPA